MGDWTVAAASGVTAAGTLVLAGATFSYVRSSQRSARATEAALLASIRPVLVTSDPDDPAQKVGFADNHWVVVRGGRVSLEVTEDAIYLVVSVKNVGNGLAVLDRYEISPERSRSERSSDDVSEFRRLSRDIYVAPKEIGFWQAAIRDVSDPLFDGVRKAIEERSTITVDILYGDHLGGQRTISRFTLSPAPDDQWFVSVGRHWSLDQPSPR